MSWIQTFSGVAFHPLEPRPEDVRIKDIAHSLAHQCRFAGHTRNFYSVAEHSWFVSTLVPQEGALPLAGLLHDGGEAYFVDIPKPLKDQLYATCGTGRESVSMLEFRIQQAIAQALDVTAPFTDWRIKQADVAMLMAEADQLLGPKPMPWGIDAAPAKVSIQCWEPDLAKSMFLARYAECRAIAGLE